MKKLNIILYVCVAALAILSYQAGAEELTLKNNEGRVAISVTYENPGKPDPAFSVRMNTHSVDLDQYDMEVLSILTDGKGKEYKGKWESPSGGGHHRSGTLVFKGVSLEGVNEISLTIKEIAGIKERSFKWRVR